MHQNTSLRSNGLSEKMPLWSKGLNSENVNSNFWWIHEKVQYNVSFIWHQVVLSLSHRSRRRGCVNAMMPLLISWNRTLRRRCVPRILWNSGLTGWKRWSRRCWNHMKVHPCTHAWLVSSCSNGPSTGRIDIGSVYPCEIYWNLCDSVANEGAV